MDGGSRGRPPKIIRDFLNPTGNCCPPRPTWKKHCLCILDSRLFIDPTLPLQGLKFNIYVHFHLVKKSLPLQDLKFNIYVHFHLVRK